jgi:hypothetical protein
LHSGFAAAADGQVDAVQAIVSDKAVPDAGLLQTCNHLGLGEFAAGDQLK